MEPHSVSQDAIRQALERVLSNSGFARNERLSGFLRFLVERHLEGRDTELKESVIAHEVFGREADYDPKLDAIVRTEAVRLRARLEKYYQTDGNQDPWIIDLPKGGYRPVLRQRLAAEPATDIPPGRPERAVRVSRIRWAAGAVAALVLVATAAVWWWTRPSRQALTIAVLPIVNQGDPANEYFADGLTDEIIRNLSLIDGVTVPSRTSSFAIKGKGLTASEAGRQLGAEYLVEGSVLHAGDQLRITVALVRARDEHRLWGPNRFDRTLTDVFAIQDEISRGIVNTLRLSLSPGRRRYETNLEAYDLYLRGRHLMASFPARGRNIALPAVTYFEQAIAKDGNYAIAYAGIADALIAIEGNVGSANPWGTTIVSKAKDAAERAIKLDPILSEGHSAMASIRAREHAWQEAERGFREAIRLNPNNALAHLELGTVLTVQERFDEGLREVRHALHLDRLSPYVNTEVGAALMLAGRYGESVDQLRKASSLDPSRTRPYNLLGRALTLQGKPEEALEAFDESIKRGISLPDGMACAEMRAGRRDKALGVLQRQLSEVRASRALARTYACLGDAEQALVHLEEMGTRNGPGLVEILQAPEFAAMRTNPRVAALRKQVNLTP